MKTTFLRMWVLLVLAGCAQDKKESKEIIPEEASKDTIIVTEENWNDEAPSIGQAFAQSIEAAHEKDDFLSKQAVTFDIDLEFGGSPHIQGKITMLTNSTKIRIDKTDGTTLIYDGNNVYQTPADIPYGGARFDMFTWTYFFALPFKLNDPGTQWEYMDKQSLNGDDHLAGRLTFDKNIGDAPDDWYVVYADPKDNRLQVAAYIVTYGGTPTEVAEQDPHAIVYKGYKTIEGIPMATRWRFYGWTQEKGLTKTLGKAKISNITFLGADDQLFEKPANAKLVE